MVEYPDLSNLNSTSGIGGLLSLPNNSFPYFWIWILGGIWFIVTLSLYYSEKERKGRGNLLGCMAVSSLSVIMLSVIGTIVGFMRLDQMVELLVFNLIVIVIWIFS